MNSVCISSCINDARDPRVPVRATYVNLYKWPGSDAEFVRSVGSNTCHGGQPRSRVVDSISCRQIYLRSYPFSKEESPNRTKCFSLSNEKAALHRKKKKKKKRKPPKKKCVVLMRMKEVPCSVLYRFFHRLLSCTASVDVLDQ